MRFLYALIIFTCFFACQDATQGQTTVQTETQVPKQPKPTAEELARAKTDSLLQKYPSQDGYIELTWDTLANMDFNMQFVSDEEGEGVIPYPIFSEALKELDGELVYIKGYVIPFEETGDETVVFLSAYPYTQCFFCGAAGPESVVDVLSKEKFKDLKMDEKTIFRGRLRLNGTDLDFLNYILDDAERVRE